MKNKELADLICDRISQRFVAGDLDNDDMVQIIAHCGGYLNLTTRSAWAKETGKTYNAAKKCRRNVKLFNTTLIIDND